VTKPILLIDNEVAYRQSVVDLFEGTDCRVVEAASVAEGVAHLKADPELQVILLDLLLDGDSGISLLKHIAGRSSSYRVIVLTGHDEMLLAEEAGKYDVFHYLAKADAFPAQSIRFSVAQAFQHLDHAQLAEKTECLLQGQAKVTRNEPIADILDFICECVRRVTGAYTCHIRVYDFKGGDFHIRGFAGPDQELRSLFGLPKAKSDDFTGEVLRNRMATPYTNLQSHPDFLRFKAEALARTWESNEVRDQVRTYFERVASAYIAPIFTGFYGRNLVDAVLNVSSDQSSYFTQDRQNLVDEFVNQAALAITRDWLQAKRLEAHQDYGDISKMLADMSNATREQDPLKTVYKVVTDRIAKIVGPEIISVFRYDNHTGIVKNVAEVRGRETIEEPDEQYRCGISLTGHVVLENEGTIHLPPPDDPNPKSPTQDKRFDKDNEKKYLEMIPSGALKHYLGVPIRMGGHIRGVLRALNKKSRYYDDGPPKENPRCLLERGFSQDCRNALEIAANHLAAAIHNVELLGEKDRQVHQIRTLGEVGRLINSEMHIKEVLATTIRKMHELWQAEISMLFLKDEAIGRVVLKHVFGAPEDRVPGAVREVGEAVTAEVERSRTPRLIDSMEAEYDAITSLMAVPIQARDHHFLGVMIVINKAGSQQKYDQNDLDLFLTFADYVAVAIENAEIYELTNNRLAIAEKSSALSLLVSAVAHEINNTSGVIPLTVDALREYLLLAGNDDINGMLDVIEDAANQASEFANELAGFSSNRVGPKQALDVNTVIRQAVNLLNKQHSEPGTTKITLSLPGKLVCDIFKNPFKQIVRNIVINSIQALEGKQEGIISISSRKVSNGEGMVEVRFEDNGPGIPPEYHDKIFEAEFTTKPKGNGIGLWLARIQLGGVGGTIEVDKEMKHGAAFVVHIPLSTNPEAADDNTDPSPGSR
jgi:signal transduction histidine kinase/ActR/RegA family two-component response regulator